MIGSGGGCGRNHVNVVKEMLLGSRATMGVAIPPEMTRSCPPGFIGLDLDEVEDVVQKEEYWNVRRVVPVEGPAVTSTEPTSLPVQTKRLIQVDFSVLQSDDEDDEPAQSAVSSGKIRPSDSGVFARTAYDLATQCPSRRPSMRRHTIVVCEAERGTLSVPQSRPLSRQSDVSRSSGGEELAQLGTTNPEMSWSRTSLQEDLFQSVPKTWAQECLSLTLEEIVHIRSVLTKAELEALPVDGHVKEDVEKRKVCFLCLKTRFSIFGSWGQKCRLCQRTICAKCVSKMRIPTEHFSHVPVVALSPSLLNSPEEDDSFPKSLASRLGVPESRNSVGSAPSSPQLTRESSSAPGSRAMSRLGQNDGALSLPPASPASTTSERRGRMSRSRTLLRSDRKSEKLKGMEMTVCHDCKAMVIQIIKSSRTTRNNAIRNLTLNLSPVY